MLDYLHSFKSLALVILATQQGSIPLSVSSFIVQRMFCCCLQHVLYIEPHVSLPNAQNA
jgi:hypothetical protein